MRLPRVLYNWLGGYKLREFKREILKATAYVDAIDKGGTLDTLIRMIDGDSFPETQFADWSGFKPPHIMKVQLKRYAFAVREEERLRIVKILEGL